MLRSVLRAATSLTLCGALFTSAFAAAPAAMKADAAAHIDANAKLVQVMVDTVFSYGEPGFQEFKTSAYLTGILEKTVSRSPMVWPASLPPGPRHGARADH